MAFNKPILQTSNSFKPINSTIIRNRTIFYGEVVSIIDDTNGGRIKVRISELDNQINDENLPWSYPLMPKFFHIYPQVGEIVRVFLEDNKFPERSRFWLGSVISQPQKIGFDSKFTALSTTNLGLTNPDKSINTYPDADGVFPHINDVGIIGKINTDILLKPNEVLIRAGKHVNDNPFELNVKNPASINMMYEPSITNGDYYSGTIIQSDKIALISHSGNPTFKSTRLTKEDRNKVFEDGHPIARADVLIDALEVIRLALITHIHPYSGVSVDRTEIISKLENLQFELISQNNVVTN